MARLMATKIPTLQKVPKGKLIPKRKPKLPLRLQSI